MRDIVPNGGALSAYRPKIKKDGKRRFVRGLLLYYRLLSDKFDIRGIMWYNNFVG